MIELSKCPNCASEDRVTIAGKDFCMRCGTPSEDNAMISAEASQANATGPSTTPSTAEVARFNQQSESIEQTTTAQVPMAQQVESSSNEAIQNDPNPITTQAQQPGTGIDMEAEKAIADNRINELSQKTSAPLTTNPAPMTPAPLVPNVISTLPDSEASNSPAPTQPPTPMPQQGMPTANPAPTPIDMSSKVNEAVNSAQPAIPQPEPTSNTMPVQSPISLDKDEPGVFSDEDFDALSNTQVEPSAATVQQPTTPQSQANFVPSPAPTLAPTSAPLQQASNVLQVQPLGPNPSNPSATKKVLKPVGVVASIALVLATGYYMWRVNYPNLAFKIASSKAGISASMPGYVPDGYKLSGNIQTSPGSVSYSLSSQGSKKIQISQSKTDWDSQALAENFVAPKADNYLALQAQGLTIYMMGNNQASWVNKGTWYRVESPTQPLTQEQVIRIATSL